MRTLLGLWTWFAFATISAVGFCICLAIFVTTIWFDPTRKLTGRAIRITGRLMCAAVPAWHFGYLQPLPSELPERLVCVSNHASNIDPFLVAHLPWEMKYLAKSSLFQIPFVGWGIGIAGDIPLVRGSHRSIKNAMRRVVYYVERGMPVLIFPEGTRSRTGEMLPFKDGAFRIAIETRAHVLPMAVGGTVGALRKGDWRPGYARAVVKVGEPIPAQGLTMDDLQELKARVRDRVQELREQLSELGYE